MWTETESSLMLVGITAYCCGMCMPIHVYNFSEPYTPYFALMDTVYTEMFQFQVGGVAPHVTELAAALCRR
jgi:hypothetical protein